MAGEKPVSKASSKPPADPGGDNEEAICPLRSKNGAECRKHCIGPNRYRSLMEHIRRSHPDSYTAHVRATEENILAMINKSRDPYSQILTLKPGPGDRTNSPVKTFSSSPSEFGRPLVPGDGHHRSHSLSGPLPAGTAPRAITTHSGPPNGFSTFRPISETRKSISHPAEFNKILGGMSKPLGEINTPQLLPRRSTIDSGLQPLSDDKVSDHDFLGVDVDAGHVDLQANFVQSSAEPLAENVPQVVPNEDDSQFFAADFDNLLEIQNQMEYSDNDGNNPDDFNHFGATPGLSDEHEASPQATSDSMLDVAYETPEDSRPATLNGNASLVAKSQEASISITDKPEGTEQSIWDEPTEAETLFAPTHDGSNKFSNQPSTENFISRHIPQEKKPDTRIIPQSVFVTPNTGSPNASPLDRVLQPNELHGQIPAMKDGQAAILSVGAAAVFSKENVGEPMRSAQKHPLPDKEMIEPPEKRHCANGLHADRPTNGFDVNGTSRRMSEAVGLSSAQQQPLHLGVERGPDRDLSEGVGAEVSSPAIPEQVVSAKSAAQSWLLTPNNNNNTGSHLRSVGLATIRLEVLSLDPQAAVNGHSTGSHGRRFSVESAAAIDMEKGLDSRQQQLTLDTKLGSPTLACPYRVYEQALEDGLRGECGNLDEGFATIPELLQHLTREHTQSRRCEHCWSTFDTQELALAHKTQPITCAKRTAPAHLGLMTIHHEVQLQKLCQKGSEEDIWWRLFCFLIPSAQGRSADYLKNRYSAYHTNTDMGSFVIPAVTLPNLCLESIPGGARKKSTTPNGADAMCEAANGNGRTLPTPPHNSAPVAQTLSVPLYELRGGDPSHRLNGRPAAMYTPPLSGISDSKAFFGKQQPNGNGGNINDAEETAHKAATDEMVKKDLERIYHLMDHVLAMDGIPDDVFEKLERMSGIITPLRAKIRAA